MIRIAECPRCKVVYKAEEPLEELALYRTRRLGTMNETTIERYCPSCQESLKDWRGGYWNKKE